MTASPLKTVLILGLFSFVGLGLVSLVNYATQTKIADNEYQAQLQSLQQLIPQNLYDNDIINDRIITAQQIIYRARKQGKSVAVVIASKTQQGYNGTIKLLVAIWKDGSIAGVDIVSHQETPGLGDKVETRRSQWLQGFNQQSFTTIKPEYWTVKREGGAFDQLTGATITPRAIIHQVKACLLYYQNHRDEIFN